MMQWTSILDDISFMLFLATYDRADLGLAAATVTD